MKNSKCFTHWDWITGAGLTRIAVLAIVFGRPAEEARLRWGEMIRVDKAGYLLSLLVLVGGALTAVFAGTDETVGKKPEFYLLLTLSSIGLVLMGTTATLLML